MVPISQIPFRIGRQPDTSFCLPNPSVSKLHAELVYQDQALWVRDLGSTNGTFVNYRRLTEPMRLEHDDLLQFSSEAFRIQRVTAPQEALAQTMQGAFVQIQELGQFDRLMSERAVIPHFQAITSLATRRVVGYEMLARSSLEGLQSPGQMFAAAQRVEQESELSMMLRLEGVRSGLALPGKPALFVNTHPKEVVTPQFLASLTEIRAIAPAQPLVIEIHEAAVTDPATMQLLRQKLSMFDIRLAYDDFGAGQARLDELTEFPPDYVKFDIKLIRNIHEATLQRRQMLGRLVEMVRALGAVAIAEGVEVADEAETCRNLGFMLAQGYYFSRPQPLSALLAQASTSPPPSPFG
jgi:EAL domain-containing protein (putative c-di-GMP-specific phosphodiesterase class I)